MRRTEFYTACVACILADLGTDDKVRLWRELESLYLAEFQRAHPMASPQTARAAFADLAKRIIAAQ